ncbi:hypothetical protein KAR91_29190 [Candidatus Pacearchaeota archaeon]|nr:hypothetical protein [Candidatus Pacearchaeota archaeon]
MPKITQNTIQDLKREHFTKPQEHQVSGILIKVVPMPRDIPLLEDQSFDVFHDIFRVTFKNSGVVIQKKIDDKLSFLTDKKTGYFAGFSVCGVKEHGIKEITLEIVKKLEDFKLSLQEKLKHESKEEIIKQISRYDQNERRVDFIKDALKDL